MGGSGPKQSEQHFHRFVTKLHIYPKFQGIDLKSKWKQNNFQAGLFNSKSVSVPLRLAILLSMECHLSLENNWQRIFWNLSYKFFHKAIFINVFELGEVPVQPVKKIWFVLTFLSGRILLRIRTAKEKSGVVRKVGCLYIASCTLPLGNEPQPRNGNVLIADLEAHAYALHQLPILCILDSLFTFSIMGDFLKPGYIIRAIWSS